MVRTADLKISVGAHIFSRTLVILAVAIEMALGHFCPSWAAVNFTYMYSAIINDQFYKMNEL